MDTITHIVLGATLGEAIAGKKMGKRAMLWGALANNIPDIDVFLSPFQSVSGSLLSHRGFTHSILFALLFTFLLSWCFNRIYHKRNYSLKTWLWIFSTGLFGHLIMDSLTNYGTGWFEPFSHYRVSFNTIFVLDPFYTIAFLTAFIALLILRSGSSLRRYFVMGGFAISTAYLLFTFINKFSINDIFKKSLHELNTSYSSFLTTPTPLNNFLWYCLAKNDDGFYIGYRSIFDTSQGMKLNFLAKNDSLLKDVINDSEVQKLIRFSQGYYSITNSDSALNFHDLRFGQVGGWHSIQAPFVFTYQIVEGYGGQAHINEGRFKASTGEEFRALIDRICNPE